MLPGRFQLLGALKGAASANEANMHAYLAIWPPMTCTLPAVPVCAPRATPLLRLLHCFLCAVKENECGMPQPRFGHTERSGTPNICSCIYSDAGLLAAASVRSCRHSSCYVARPRAHEV